MKKYNEDEIDEARAEFDKEISFISVVFYTILLTITSVFIMLMIQPALDSAFNFRPELTFAEYWATYLEGSEAYQEIVSQNPENAQDMVAIMIQGFFQIFLEFTSAYFQFITTVVQDNDNLRIQLAIMLLISFAAIFLLYLILYMKRMNKVSIFVGFAIGFTMSYIIMAVILRGIFVYAFWGVDYEVVAHMVDLSSNWLSFENMLITVLMIIHVLDINWLVIWLVYVLMLNLISVSISFLIQRIFYRIDLSDVNIDEPESFSSDLDESATFTLFSIVVGSLMLFLSRQIATLITIITWYNHDYMFYMFFGLTAVGYYIAKWLTYELFKFFFKSDKSIVQLYRVKQERIPEQVFGLLVYTFFIAIVFISFIRSSSSMAWYLEMLLHAFFLTLSLLLVKYMRYR